MATLIEDVSQGDLAEILLLNESEVPHVGRVDIERMHWFAEHATYFRVAKVDDQLGGFLIGLRPGTAYQSPNYLWFCDRFDDFAYVDRIAIATAGRRRGLASSLYDDFAAAMPATVKRLTCEVNVLPPNEDSMKFHTRLGFREVGTLSSEDSSKKVALLQKDL